MRKRCAFVLTASFLICWSAVESTLRAEIVREDTVAIHSTREENGGWVTTATTYDIIEYEPNRTTVELKRRVIECDGKQITLIKVTIRGPSYNAFDPRKERLLFHRIGGKHLVVSDDGTTALRKDELENIGHAGVLTNRPLMNDEMFEVKLDKLSIKYDDSMGIGVTHHLPDVMDYLDWMPCGTIILYDNKLYENGVATKKKYGPNLGVLKVGDRVGVMKKSNGDLHFFVNGDDQGVAQSNITYTVYGVLDLYAKGVQATIISPEE